MRIGFRSNQAEDLGNDAPMRHENPGDGKEAARVAVVELRPEIDIEPQQLVWRWLQAGMYRHRKVTRENRTK
jgi:hypothetical protein